MPPQGGAVQILQGTHRQQVSGLFKMCAKYCCV